MIGGSGRGRKRWTSFYRTKARSIPPRAAHASTLIAAPEPPAASPGAPAVSETSLFRPEAIREPEFGDAFAFAIPRWRSLGFLALTASGLALLFSIFANFDRVAIVPGVVAPISGVARLTAPKSGVVTAVLARQGAVVPRGTALIRIASADRLPNGTGASAEMLRTWQRQQQLAEGERNAERIRTAAERQRLLRTVTESSSAIESLRTQATLQRQRIANGERRLRDLTPLRAKGYVSAVTYAQQEEVLLTLRQQLAVIGQGETEAENGLASARLRLAELDAASRRSDLAAEGTLLDLQRGAAGAQVEAEVTLAAPLAGTVAAMLAAPGQSVTEDQELVTVVRAGDAMEAILFVPSAAGGSLKPGLDVALRYDAFPYQRHGVGHGIVTDIAATATAERPDAPPTYRVKVRLTNPKNFPLRPDMTLSGVVTLERLSLLEWLLAPLRETWRENRVGPSA